MSHHTPLRRLRRARTIRQADLARIVDVAQSTLSRYESGRLVPPADVQARLAAVLGGSTLELFPEAPEAPEAVPVRDSRRRRRTA